MMREENTVFLSRDEWDDFHRRLNRYDPERERRVNAMFEEYNRTVSVHRSEDQVELELPWLDDEEIVAALSAEKTTEHKMFSAEMRREDIWTEFQSAYPVQNLYANLNAREITAEGKYMFMQTESYSQALMADTGREYAGDFKADSLLRCA